MVVNLDIPFNGIKGKGLNELISAMPDSVKKIVGMESPIQT